MGYIDMGCMNIDTLSLDLWTYTQIRTHARTHAFILKIQTHIHTRILIYIYIYIYKENIKKNFVFFYDVREFIYF